jgi:uncharacterized membrane protein YoaK (UPF0700 family)
MTGTTTQIMIDVADILHHAPASVFTAAKHRLFKMSVAVAAFALGCAAGACIYAKLGTWCFVIPPLLTLPAIFLASPDPAPQKGA